MANHQARKRSKSVRAPTKRTRRSGNNPKPLEDSQPAAPGNATEPTSAAFAFSVAQLNYLMALREAADEGRRTSDRALSEELKMSRTTIWEWKHDPLFTAWLREELKSESDHNFELAVARHSRLAIQGSVRSFEALARLRSIGIKIGCGQVNAPESPTAYTLNLLVPRPGGEP